MNERLLTQTKIAAYLLWEQTNSDNALELWYCAEDMACFLESHGIFEKSELYATVEKGKHDIGYIWFVQHMSFRIFLYTGNDYANSNWFTMEKLLHNREWCSAITEMAGMYNKHKANSAFIKDIQSNYVRKFYGV